MAALRTQIYLTAEQRKQLDEIAREEGKSLAELIRLAVDGFLENRTRKQEEIERILDETFGALPNFSIPSRKELWGKRGARFGRH